MQLNKVKMLHFGICGGKGLPDKELENPYCFTYVPTNSRHNNSPVLEKKFQYL